MSRHDEESPIEMDQPFTIRMRGYDRDEVDLYISQLFGELDSASALIEELRNANPTKPEEVLGAEVERVLREARALATNVSGDAEEQASGLVEKARADSKRMLDGARTKSGKTTADAQDKAERMVANARTEAERIIAESRTRLEAMQKAEKELAARLEEAVRATQAVVAGIQKSRAGSGSAGAGAGSGSSGGAGSGPSGGAGSGPQASSGASPEAKAPARQSETAPIDLTRSHEDPATRTS